MNTFDEIKYFLSRLCKNKKKPSEILKLDKPEMDDTNKKLEDGKEDLDKKEIKETLHRIETTLGKIEREMAEGKKFNFWCVFSGFSIAAGLGMISISIRHDPIATVSGVCMLVVGAVILSRCFIKFKRI